MAWFPITTHSGGSEYTMQEDVVGPDDDDDEDGEKYCCGPCSVGGVVNG
jgi:hypothetical protein